MEIDSSETKAGAIPDGWTWTVKQRTEGKTAGQFDWYIYK